MTDKLLYCKEHNVRYHENSPSKKEHDDKYDHKCQWEEFNPEKHILGFDIAQIVNEEDLVFNISKKNNTREEIVLLDYPIRTLKPQTLLDDGRTLMLVYLPTKVTKIKKNGDTETITDENFVNTAFFVVSVKELNEVTKKVVPYNDSYLSSNFRIRVIPEWNDVRWDIHDLKNWLEEKESMDPKTVYDLMLETSSRYIEFPDLSDNIKFVLWNIGTYCYQLFDAYPYNDFTGTKQAGKSKALEFQKLCCYNAIKSPDMSSSSMFRIIEGLGASVLLDETEQFKNQKNEHAQHIRTLIMQGYTKDQYAVRSVSKENDFTPTTFDIYGPKSLAHINAFDDTLEDRCIAQLMRRSIDNKIKNSHPTERDPSFRQIRNLCYRLFMDYGNEIHDIQEEARSLLKVSGREQQLWLPIVALALFFERHGIDGLMSLIESKISQSTQNRKLQEEEESIEVKVIRFLDDACANVLNEGSNSWITASDLYSNLMSDEKRWGLSSEWFKQKKLGEILARLGFKKRRIDKGIQYQITKETVNEVKQRLEITDNIENSQSKPIVQGLDTYTSSPDHTHHTYPTLPTPVGIKSETESLESILHHPTPLDNKSMPEDVGSVGSVGNVGESRGKQSEDFVPKNVGMYDSVGLILLDPTPSYISYTEQKTHFTCYTCNSKGSGPFPIDTKITGHKIYDSCTRLKHNTRLLTDSEAELHREGKLS
jgi:hypothetical protein